MAAGDTFRAAAAEQLTVWADRSGADLVRGAEGADPSSIIFDAIESAAAKGAELVLADTAGRLHTKSNLMEELRKVRRVASKPPGHVTEVLLVLDATTGQNGLVQAQQFTEAVEVTGVVLTKLDGSAKGGIVFAIQSQLGIPVKLVGLGETVDDLVAFDPDEFVDALFCRLIRRSFHVPLGSFFPIRLSLKMLRLSLRLTGTSNALLLGVGVVIGLLIAPTSGAELRQRLQERMDERRSLGPDGPGIRSASLPQRV